VSDSDQSPPSSETAPARRGGASSANLTVFVAGATGFIGRHLVPVLELLGYRVVCGSRRPERAQAAHPSARWVAFDVDDAASVEHALQGCDAAFYLVHELGAGARYPEREARAARVFRDAAARAGMRRIVYLGGVAPRGGSSRHLQSRLKTGALLRAARVSTLELRAAMIIGRDSTSFRMVRDLAKRLPAMILPRWLNNHSWPVAVDDIVVALVTALQQPGDESAWYDAPGPERVSHREMLARTAAQFGHHPTLVGVPVLTPKLSSYWIALVTGIPLRLARELVQGLRYELDPSGRSIWDLVSGWNRTPLSAAIGYALQDERAAEAPSNRYLERMRAWVAHMPAGART
jgi:uncharacterized protein YbjT (DUF2867 family)